MTTPPSQTPSLRALCRRSGGDTEEHRQDGHCRQQASEQPCQSWNPTQPRRRHAQVVLLTALQRYAPTRQRSDLLHTLAVTEAFGDTAYELSQAIRVRRPGLLR
jgi:hypothetical protein